MEIMLAILCLALPFIIVKWVLNLFGIRLSQVILVLLGIIVCLALFSSFAYAEDGTEDKNYVSELISTSLYNDDLISLAFDNTALMALISRGTADWPAYRLVIYDMSEERIKLNIVSEQSVSLELIDDLCELFGTITVPEGLFYEFNLTDDAPLLIFDRFTCEHYTILSYGA